MQIVSSFDWEIPFMTYLQSNENSFFNLLMTLFSFSSEALFIVALIGGIYWCVNKEKGEELIVTVITALLCGTFLKLIFRRQRPYFANENVKCIRKPVGDADVLDEVKQGFSFPSQHSTLASSFYGKIILFVKKIWFKILLALLILLVGLSRIYFGVHYPTDVLAGLLLGFVVMLVMNFIMKKVKHKEYILLTLSILGTVGLFLSPNKDFLQTYGLSLGLTLGVIVEKKLINFEKPLNKKRGSLRLICGLLLFALIDNIIKYLTIMYTLDTLLGMIFLVLRYFVCTFVVIGIYPMCFKRKED